MGVAVWPMIELEADDALASAAHIAAQDSRVEKVASGRLTRISRNASSEIAWSKSIEEKARFAMRRVSGPSSVSRRR